MTEMISSLMQRKRTIAVAVVFVILGALLGAVAVGPAIFGENSDGDICVFEVSFPVEAFGREIGAGSLPYDEYVVLWVNVSRPNLTLFEARLEWEDQGNTPLQDPNVNLWINYQDDSELDNIAEIDAPGGMISVEVPNEVPKNATVRASNAGEAISAASAGVNNSTMGMGDWQVRLNAQAPSDVRPFVGGSIYYRVWVTLHYYEGKAEVVISG